MLIFTRRLAEGFFIGENVHIKLLGIEGGQVRIGIDAPTDVDVDRDEVRRAKTRNALLEASRRQVHGSRKGLG